MSGMAGALWCAAGAPVVQGVLVGLGVSATGLVFFPFDVTMTRPRTGPQTGFAQATAAVWWARRLSWLVAGLSAVTIGGYVVIFVAAGGRFCGAQLSPAAEMLVVIWSIVTGVTLVTLAVSAGLRRRARRGTDA